jgi:hypothetical protein
MYSTSVDIYHTDPKHPRFAYVQYTTFESGAAAISTLDKKPIDFASTYAQENAADLSDWQGWQGQMNVVRNEKGRFIPKAVEDMFPGIAGWMIGKPTKGSQAGHDGAPVGEDGMEKDRASKRSRSVERNGSEARNGAQAQ